ncbi:MAG TPA: hypothetical protein VGK19_13300 [Capsulimonadaceae bacterium]|jgi:hypothetical protein
MLQTQSNTYTTISLANGVEIDLNTTGGGYHGIASARLGGVPFLVAGRGSKPYFATPDGVVYHSFRTLAVRDSAFGATVHLAAIGTCAPVKQDVDVFLFPQLSAMRGEVEDELDVAIEPRSITLNGETYHGFSIGYAFRSTERSIHWLLESVGIAPGGSLDGSSVMAQHMTSNICRLEEPLTIDTRYTTEENYGTPCIQAPCRGGGSQIFDIVHGDGMAVVTGFEKPDTLKSAVVKEPGEAFVTSTDFHYAALANEFTAQPRIVVATFTKPGESRARRVNRWTAWHDHTSKLWQSALGIRHTESLPVIAFDGTGGGGVDPGTTYPELLTDWAGRMAWLNEQGVRGVILHTPEWQSAGTEPTVIFGGNNCSPMRYRLSSLLGGDEGLKAFCDTAHEHDIKVYLWISGHVHIEAPIWKEHPEWAARYDGGALWDGNYKTIHALSFIHGGREWLAADLLHTRRATGADGVWFDSFTNLALQAINYQSPGREPNAPGVFGFLGDLSAMGYEIMIECMSQFGVSSWGNLKPEALHGQEELLYNTSLRTYLDDWLSDPAYTADYYFRALAAKGPLGMWIREYRGKPAPFPLTLPEWYTPLTNAYLQVAPRMHTRELLEDDAGVLWRDETGAPSALFVMTDGNYTFDAPATDVTTGAALPAGPANVAAQHIYRIEG